MSMCAILLTKTHLFACIQKCSLAKLRTSTVNVVKVWRIGHGDGVVLQGFTVAPPIEDAENNWSAMIGGGRGRGHHTRAHGPAHTGC